MEEYEIEDNREWWLQRVHHHKQLMKKCDMLIDMTDIDDTSSLISINITPPTDVNEFLKKIIKCFE